MLCSKGDFAYMTYTLLKVPLLVIVEKWNWTSNQGSSTSLPVADGQRLPLTLGEGAEERVLHVASLPGPEGLAGPGDGGRHAVLVGAHPLRLAPRPVHVVQDAAVGGLKPVLCRTRRFDEIRWIAWGRVAEGMV